MSTRYGIGLALEPGFTSRAYRARQLICGQYASWAAEMNMVYLTVAGFFQCAESAVPSLDSALSAIADRSRERSAQFPMSHAGVSIRPDAPGDIYLDFGTPNVAPALSELHMDLTGMLRDTPGIVAGLLSQHGEYRPHLPLMQHAKLPGPVFSDAVEFARAVAADLQIPSGTQAWRLLLLRFESDAAGDDWSGGSWAADLRWELLASYPL